ncbi:hypothetical protein IDH44_17775 [Paenibacillus sp. IB182496]|uniref:Uncharacterized protein n=1 Tax=Paenibacillus sabuli TaxID=2772509 RepID=A0A927GTF7_9BACL|nr:hypothetical protein [Paenibacillus sabuli]MBD2847050.1 hypothetical protein [Paenibacillus sabuli]
MQDGREQRHLTVLPGNKQAQTLRGSVGPGSGAREGRHSQNGQSTRPYGYWNPVAPANRSRQAMTNWAQRYKVRMGLGAGLEIGQGNSRYGQPGGVPSWLLDPGKRKQKTDTPDNEDRS